MEPPIFVDDAGDLNVFLTTEAAECWLEPYDVGDPRRFVYDAKGTLLKQDIVRVDTWLGRLFHTTGLLQRVQIEVAEGAPQHEQELSDKLRDFLTVLGHSKESVRNASLEQLVELSKAYPTT
jgi:hypothetical protein